MKKIFSLLIISLIVHSLSAQSGVGYDPENPADPNVYYSLTLDASPRAGGSVSPTNKLQKEAGEEVYCYARAKLGYEFKQWMEGDSVVSTESRFSYTMPNRDVVLVAYFDYVGNDYNPENPSDPFEDGYKHKVKLYAAPSVGGYFNSGNFLLTEGETTNVYAYPSNGYRFVSWKKDGNIISTSNPMEIKMGTEDLEYTATFVYDPQSPGNPSPNNFNAATGEVVIDEFTAGDLNEAIETVIGGWDNYSLVQSIVVVGEMSSYDFGFSYNMTNCSLIDLARTTGYTEVPSWSFEGNTALTKIVLPSSVERIGYSAFYNCENLSEIACYSLVPPTIGTNAFYGVLDGLVVRVPSSALSSYAKADGWKNFTLLPLDEETCAISVALPDDSSDGRYKNMTLELNNISSGQVLKYLITDRNTYTFANLVRDTKYNVFVKNATGTVLGSIFDIEVGTENVDVKFESLLQPKTVGVKVMTPTGEDVTSEVSITWLSSDGVYLCQGATLKNVIEGTIVKYSIDLNQSLGVVYVKPQEAEYIVTNTDNDVVCVLSPFEELTACGAVKDVTSNNAIQNATVTISQLLNGKYTKSQTVHTDKNGEYTVTLYVAPTSVTFAANNYVSQSYEVADKNTAESLKEVYLKSITGAVVSVNFTYSSRVKESEDAEVQNWYSDYANVEYKIYNKTTQKNISEFNVQGSSIVLLEEVNTGDVLAITAVSKNGSFADVVAEGVVSAANRIDVTIPIFELGGIEAVYMQSGNKSNVGILYDANGRLVRKSNYVGNTLTLSDIADGNYTLVSMGNSSFYNSILNVSELEKSGIVENRDYVKNEISVTSGKISVVNVSEVPAFDESLFYYTGANTTFTVNKAAVTVGNYVTLRAKVDFKDEYAGSVSDVKLIFDLPENCNFVENSVLSGAGTGSYFVEGSRITVYMSNITDLVRFCVIPTVGGDCKPSAFVQFTLNGENIMQPIGSAYFEAENMKIVVPEKTSNTSVVVSGVATSDSQIKIYDNGILVGQTTSLANGQWSSKIELYKPYSWSLHKVYAEIISKDNQKFVTDTKRLEYDKNFTVISKITMLYNGNTIVFDMIEGENNTNSYSYVPGTDSFTFIAEFTKNDTSLVKNLDFIVLASDGSLKRLAGMYNERRNAWIAQARYTNSAKLPINVAVEYIGVQESPIYDDEMDDDFNQQFNTVLEEIEPVYSDCPIDIISQSEKDVYFSIMPNNYEHKEYFKFIIEDYNNVANNNANLNYYHIENDSVDFCFIDKMTETTYQITIWDNNKKEAYTILNNGTMAIKDNNEQLKFVQLVPLIISATYGIGAGIWEYYYKLPEIESWYNTLNVEKEQWQKYYSKAFDTLYARCDDGTMKIKDSETVEYNKALIENWWNLTSAYLSKFEKQIDVEQSTLRTQCTLKGTASVMFSAAGAIVSGFGTIVGQTCTNLSAIASALLSSVALNAITEVAGQALSYITGEVIDDSKPLKQSISDWYCDESKNVTDEYINVTQTIKGSYSSCEKEEEEDEEDDKIFTNPNLKPVIDPSGYVYEAVSSNRLAGVTATAYYKELVEDMYGDLHEKVVKWNAEEYAQENPLFTDENGMYAWDVPQGQWQVKFEKDGYETTYSEWLPVPPPQLDVNIGMTQVRQPEVKQVRAYTGGVEIEFDKYMMPETLTTDNIYVSENGQNVEGEIVMLNEEVSYEGESTKYVSRLRFNVATPFTAKEITLTVANKVKSYAGIQMRDTYTQTFDVEQEMTTIEVDSLVELGCGEGYTLRVKVLPAEASAGKTMVVESNSTLIATVSETEVMLDDNGEAEITVVGELPGVALLHYSINGYNVEATTMLNVSLVNVQATANPVASVESGSVVTKGTTVSLSCETPGAVIYYTLDGTCPCDLATRKVYDGTPIVINETTTLKIMACAEGYSESEVITYLYTVNSSSGIDNVSLDDSLRIYPIPVKDVLNVSAGGIEIKRVSVMDVSGKCVAVSNDSATKVSIDVGNLPAGIYVAKIETTDDVSTRKVLKLE